MRKFIFGLVAGFALAYAVSAFAREVIVNFSDKSVPVLNEELRQIRATLDDHEARLDDGGL